MNVNDIRGLFEYTDYANRRILDASEHLAEEHRRQDFGISYGSIYGTLAHMLGAEWIWKERWKGVSPPRIWTADDFQSFRELRTRWLEVESDRRAWIESLSEGTLNQPWSYRNLKGEACALPLGAQMQHVVNHATHHRGQVVGMIRQLGVQPPNVDLLYYLMTK